nr:MAG TPA: hypothetical protein [Bacteriophage sp.]
MIHLLKIFFYQTDNKLLKHYQELYSDLSLL